MRMCHPLSPLNPLSVPNSELIRFPVCMPQCVTVMELLGPTMSAEWTMFMRIPLQSPPLLHMLHSPRMARLGLDSNGNARRLCRVNPCSPLSELPEILSIIIPRDLS